MIVICLFRCKDCSQYLFPDDTVVSANGKKIPLNHDTKKAPRKGLGNLGIGICLLPIIIFLISK